MPIELEEAGLELKNNFAGIENNEYFHDFVTVNFLLGNGNTLFSGLKALDAALLTRLQERFWFFNRPSAQQARGYFTGRTGQKNQAKDVRYSHLLSEELTASEQKHGFRFDTSENPKARLFLGNIRAKTFLKNVQEKRHWKDPGAGVAHGEFTHRIQWYLMCRTSASFRHPVADVFSQIGNWYEGTLEAEVGGFQAGNFYALWDVLVDRMAVGGKFSAVDDKDYRSPEKLHTALKKDTINFPLLGSFLVMRSNKRSGQGEYDKFNMGTYVAKKLFNKPESQLNSREKEEIEKFFLAAGKGNGLLGY